MTLGFHLEQAMTHTPQLWWEFARGVDDGQEEAVRHGQQVALVFLQHFIVVQSGKQKSYQLIYYYQHMYNFWIFGRKAFYFFNLFQCYLKGNEKKIIINLTIIESKIHELFFPVFQSINLLLIKRIT